MASCPITSWQIDRERMETVRDFIFGGSKIPTDGDCSHNSKKCLLLERKTDQPRQHMKKQRHYFANKGLSSQGYGFSSSHVWMWELDYKESWVLRNWCFWTVVLEKTLESPLDCKEIQPIHPKGNQSLCWSWNSNTLATWCEDQLIGKDPDSGKDWRLAEKGMTKNEMVGWHHRCNGRELE